MTVDGTSQVVAGVVKHFPDHAAMFEYYASADTKIAVAHDQGGPAFCCQFIGSRTSQVRYCLHEPLCCVKAAGNRLPCPSLVGAVQVLRPLGAS